MEALQGFKQKTQGKSSLLKKIACPFRYWASFWAASLVTLCFTHFEKFPHPFTLVDEVHPFLPTVLCTLNHLFALILFRKKVAEKLKDGWSLGLPFAIFEGWFVAPWFTSHVTESDHYDTILSRAAVCTLIAFGLIFALASAYPSWKRFKEISAAFSLTFFLLFLNHFIQLDNYAGFLVISFGIAVQSFYYFSAMKLLDTKEVLEPQVSAQLFLGSFSQFICFLAFFEAASNAFSWVPKEPRW